LDKMTEGRFKIIFEHMDREVSRQAELQEDAIKDALEQNSEIKKLIEIINDAVPTYKPLLYSGS